MSKLESNIRQNLIINKLRRKPSTFGEICDFLDRESELQERNLRISLRTFQRDKLEIATHYHIVIDYDSSQQVYKIVEELHDEVKSRMLESFEIFNALNITDGISKYLHFEKRSPQATNNLNGIIHAIQNNFQIDFVYHKFWGSKPEQRKANPLALKEFRNRWYVVVQDTKDNAIKTFALDRRFSEFHATREHFIYPEGFSVENHFKNCFGIISPNDEKPLDIVLSFQPYQGKYIKTMPLHESQEILIDNEKELRIKLKICITFDFIKELLSYGTSMQVVEPTALILEIKEELKNTLKFYK
ncbi:MAG: WYL domain-containing protein [Bacteroidota bacterium]